MPIDVALITVSPPDDSGYVSLGISVDITKTGRGDRSVCRSGSEPEHAANAGETASCMWSEIDGLCGKRRPAVDVFPQKAPGHIAKAIGELIADLIENESTIQTGVGKIPNSVFPLPHEQERPGHSYGNFHGRAPSI